MATREDVADVRIEIANLRTYMARMESRLTRWTVGTMGVGCGITIAILKFV